MPLRVICNSGWRVDTSTAANRFILIRINQSPPAVIHIKPRQLKKAVAVNTVPEAVAEKQKQNPIPAGAEAPVNQNKTWQKKKKVHGCGYNLPWVLPISLL